MKQLVQVLIVIKKIYQKVVSSIALVFRSKTTIVILGALVVAAGLAQVYFSVMIYGFNSESKAVKTMAKIVPFPKALVNLDIVTYNDYFKEKDYIYHFYEATQQTDVDYATVDQHIIDQLIDNKLVNSLALTSGAKVTREELDTTIDEIVAQNGGNDQVSKVLSDLYGLTLDQFKLVVKTQLQREKLNDEVVAKVRARHILIKVEKDAAEDVVNAAKTKIDGIYAEISSGLDFAEAATKYSEDVGSAEQGGELQFFAKGEMVEEFSDAAFSTEVGQMSAPIRSDFGWHIIKVEEKKGTVDKSYLEWFDDFKSNSFIVKL